MSKRHVLMIDNYDSFTWNLYQYLHQSPLCGKVDVFRNDKIDIKTIENEIKPDIIFISPGPGHPSTDAGISKEVIEHFKGKLPIFGVCMGQQCIFEVFGGEVSFAGEIVHGKATTIKHDNKGMFSNVPQSVAVTRYHSLAGTLRSLPDCLEVSATTETSPSIIMGVRHKEYTIESVQFHPESILTESGQIMIDNLMRIRGGKWSDSSSAPKPNKNILTEIFEQRVKDYETIMNTPGQTFDDLLATYDLGVAPELINFYERLMSTKKVSKNVILSEFKRASPSKGDINVKAHPGLQSLSYGKGGCSAISVLTEPKWFKGSLNDLSLIRKVVNSIPERPAILRKEFVFNKYQILEARLAGADTVLLIVKMLEPELLQSLYSYSLSLGMVPLVEVNQQSELEVALRLTHNGSTSDPLVIGVNNRDLTTFNVDLNTTTSLQKAAKSSARKGDVLLLALSGISSVNDVKKYKYEDGIDGFLIGESLMRAEERGETEKFLDQLINC